MLLQILLETFLMFKSLFKKKTKPQSTPTEQRNNAIMESLIRVINEKKKTDPFIGAKIASKEIRARIAEGLKNAHGVHIESFMCVIGALAGYACQDAVREVYRAENIPLNQVFKSVTTNDGARYFYGDALNKPLAEDKYSVWNLVCGAAQSNGCTELPDMHEMFRHNSTMLGDEHYGSPRVPTAHEPGRKPIEFLKIFWPHIHPIVKKLCPNPVEWPIAYAFAAQQIMDEGKTLIDQKIAITLIMESAIAISKMDVTN